MDEELQPKPGTTVAGAPIDDKSKTRGGVRNILEAYLHIRGAVADVDVRQRILDHVTVGLVGVSIAVLLAANLLDLSPIMRIVPLAVTNVFLILYVVRRAGILLSVSPRQALILWQIILGAFWFGICGALLVMMISLMLTE